MARHIKRPIYGNCTILAPDGQPLCGTSYKRLKWYLSRGLATSESETTIRLKFEPTGRIGAKYLLSDKDNICVCCGNKKKLTRHHVVPYVFRKFFPYEWKLWSIHDIVLLCERCHDRYEVEADKLKKKLGQKYGARFNDSNRTDPVAYRAISAGSALIKYSHIIPKHQQELLLNALRKYYKKDEITAEDIANSPKISPTVKDDDFIPYGKFIVSKVKIEEFVVLWRKHFLEHAKPKHLPKFWDVNHVPERVLMNRPQDGEKR